LSTIYVNRTFEAICQHPLLPQGRTFVTGPWRGFYPENYINIMHSGLYLRSLTDFILC